jgi:hypothetical protein
MKLDEYEQRVLHNYRLLRLCNHVLTQIQEDLELTPPLTPKDKASLLLAIEDLTSTTVELLHQSREVVWTEDLQPPTPNS